MKRFLLTCICMLLMTACAAPVQKTDTECQENRPPETCPPVTSAPVQKTDTEKTDGVGKNDTTLVHYNENVKLFFNQEETYVINLLVEKDYVELPCDTVLELCGRKLIRDPRFDNYCIWCVELRNDRYVINWDAQVFITLDDYDRLEEQFHREYLIWEKAKEFNLLPESNKIDGPEYVSWTTREVYIGNKALIELLDRMGIKADIVWDSETAKVEIMTE